MYSLQFSTIILLKSLNTTVEIMKFQIQRISSLLLIALIFLLGTTTVWAKSEINSNWRGIAIKGYDTVAYFTQGKPVNGDSKYEYSWKEATWRFSSAEHLDLFKADPEKYAPQYGGY